MSEEPKRYDPKEYTENNVMTGMEVHEVGDLFLISDVEVYIDKCIYEFHERKYIIGAAAAQEEMIQKIKPPYL